MFLTTGEGNNEKISAFILEDSAYRNSRHMVTMYKVTECNTDCSVHHLNFSLSKARYQVEHAFGLLKGRFQMFEKPLRSAGEDLPFSIRLIASICIIYNFLIDEQDAVPEADILRHVAERNHRVPAEHDVNDEEMKNTREQNYEEITQEAFIRHSRWLDEEYEV